MDLVLSKISPGHILSFTCSEFHLMRSILVHAILQNGTSTTVYHADSNSSHYSYEDEGYVQVYEVSTKKLVLGQSVYITAWAINGVSHCSVNSELPACSVF